VLIIESVAFSIDPEGLFLRLFALRRESPFQTTADPLNKINGLHELASHFPSGENLTLDTAFRWPTRENLSW